MDYQEEVPQGIKASRLTQDASQEPTLEPILFLTSVPEIKQIIHQATEPLLLEIEELKGRIKSIGKIQDRQDDRLDRLENIPIKPSEKRKALLAKLDLLLATRKNQPMTFSEIGKLLELGIRSPDGKTTRRQAMTKFSKILLAQGDRYEVFKSRTVGGKMVRLVNDYYLHVLKELKRV
jgi:hypothetical protein